MRVDVFTQVPHAFGWVTEQQPLAGVLGGELELRLFNYRDTTPLRAGQVDDDPYGGGPGMLLRVDVVDAALEAAYGAARPARIVALTPTGRQLDQPLVEELAAEREVALLSSRFEGFDERIVTELASDAVSIGPYVLSGGELPAMVLIDAIVRRLPGALGSDESSLVESFSAELEGGLEYPHYTRPAEFRGWRVPEVLLSGDHRRIEEWGESRADREASGEEPHRPYDAGASAALAGGDRLDPDDRGRRADRARDQGVGREPVPDPVVVDGADPALRAQLERRGARLRGPVLRPCARLPLLLPAALAAPRRCRRLQHAARRQGGL